MVRPARAVRRWWNRMMDEFSKRPTWSPNTEELVAMTEDISASSDNTDRLIRDLEVSLDNWALARTTALDSAVVACVLTAAQRVYITPDMLSNSVTIDELSEFTPAQLANITPEMLEAYGVSDLVQWTPTELVNFNETVDSSNRSWRQIPPPAPDLDALRENLRIAQNELASAESKALLSVSLEDADPEERSLEL